MAWAEPTASRTDWVARTGSQTGWVVYERRASMALVGAGWSRGRKRDERLLRVYPHGPHGPDRRPRPGKWRGPPDQSVHVRGERGECDVVHVRFEPRNRELERMDSHSIDCSRRRCQGARVSGSMVRFGTGQGPR